MPDKETVVVDSEREDEELTAIGASLRSFDATSVRKMLSEQGVADGVVDLVVGQMSAQNDAQTKLLGRQQRQELGAYKAKLVEEFPYASADLISGANKAEMRRSAERVHKHTESIVGPLKAAQGDITRTVTAAIDERAAAWGSPPSGAVDVVRETPDTTWDSLRTHSLRDKPADLEQTKEALFADLKARGPRQMTRPSIRNVVSRQAQAAAAKP